MKLNLDKNLYLQSTNQTKKEFEFNRDAYNNSQ